MHVHKSRSVQVHEYVQDCTYRQAMRSLLIVTHTLVQTQHTQWNLNEKQGHYYQQPVKHETHY